MSFNNPAPFDPGYFKEAGAARQNAMAQAVAANKQAKIARSGRPRGGSVLCKIGLHRWDWMTTDDAERSRRCRRCGKEAIRGATDPNHEV